MQLEYLEQLLYCARPIDSGQLQQYRSGFQIKNLGIPQTPFDLYIQVLVFLEAWEEYEWPFVLNLHPQTLKTPVQRAHP